MNSNMAFNFIVTFWGEKFRDYFCELILPSLMAPGNIPALINKTDSKFLIVTTKQDWDALHKHPLFLEMLTHIEAIYFEMRMPTKDDSKMLVMSKGHKLASEYAYKNKGIGVFVTPDLVVSDGAVVRLQELIVEGRTVVLSAAIRFQYEGSIAALKAAGHMQPEKPLALSGRDLMRAVLPNLHSEVKRYIWNKPRYPNDAITSIWYKNNVNAVIHTFSWGPMAINYAAIAEHHTETFDNWTLDGDYVYANCGTDLENKVYVVTDTDELAFASFTTEDDLHFEQIEFRLQKIPFIRNFIKQAYVNQQYYSNTMDPLKQKLVKIPIYFHADDVSSKLVNLAKKTAELIGDATNLKPEMATSILKKKILYFALAKIELDAQKYSARAKVPQLQGNFAHRFKCYMLMLFLMLMQISITALYSTAKCIILIAYWLTLTIHKTINETIRIIRYITYIYGRVKYFAAQEGGMQAIFSRAKLVFLERRWSKNFNSDRISTLPSEN